MFSLITVLFLESSKIHRLHASICCLANFQQLLEQEHGRKPVPSPGTWDPKDLWDRRDFRDLRDFWDHWVPQYLWKLRPPGTLGP